MIGNCDFLKRLRNVHLEKSVATGICRVQRSPKTVKTPAKVHLRLWFQNLGKPRTAGLCGRAAGACDCGPLSVLKSNGLRHSKNPPVKFSFSLKIVPATIAKKLPPQRCFKPLLIPIFNFSHKRPTFAFTSKSGYTLTFANRIAHSGTHSETGGVSDGGAIITLDTSCTFTNIPGPGVRTANFAAFEPWPEVLSKNAESLRDSDALMRVAVPQASRPRWAALLCLQFGDVAVFSLCAQGFPHMRKRGWYHYPRRAPRAAETLDVRLPKGLICRFLRSGGHH